MNVYSWINLLPDDIIELIVHHAMAMRMQCALLSMATRYAQSSTWKELRMLILCRIHGSMDLSILMSRAWVRREWVVEPNSWVHSLKFSSADVSDIVAECLCDDTSGLTHSAHLHTKTRHALTRSTRT